LVADDQLVDFGPNRFHHLHHLCPGVSQLIQHLYGRVDFLRIFAYIGLYQQLVDIVIKAFQILCDLARVKVERKAELIYNRLGADQLVVDLLKIAFRQMLLGLSAKRIAPSNNIEQ